MTYTTDKRGFGRFYCQVPGHKKRKYVRRSDEDLLRSIAYGRYVQETVSILEQNIGTLTKMQEDKGSYYYCCPNPVAKSEGVNGGMDIDIELTCEHKNKSNGNACYPKYFTNKPCCGCCCCH